MSKPIPPNDNRMKPILIIPVDTMAAEHIKRLNDNGICPVEAKNPALVKFLDPIPSAAERSQLEIATLKFSRKMLNRETFINAQRNWIEYGFADVCRLFMACLIEGRALDSNPTKQEKEEVYFEQEKRHELQRLAKEEAKAERTAAKAKAA